MVYENKSQRVGLLGKPSEKFEYYVIFTQSPINDEPIIPLELLDPHLHSLLLKNEKEN